METIQIARSKKSAINKLYEIFTSRERFQIFLLFLASLITAFAQTVGVVSVFPFIQVVMNSSVIYENQYLLRFYQLSNIQDAKSFVLLLGTLVIFLIIFSSFMSTITVVVKTRFVLNRNHTLSYRLLKLYLSKSYSFFLQKNTSEMGKNILLEIHFLTSGYLMAAFEVLIQGMILTVMIIMLLLVNATVTLGAIVFLGGSYGLLNFIIKRKLKRSGQEAVSANEKRFRWANEALSSIKITKVMGIEEYFINNYAKCSAKYAKNNIFMQVAAEMPRYILEAVAFGVIVLIILINLSTGNDISQLMPLVSLFAFAGYRMMPAIHRIYGSVANLQYYQASLEKIYQEISDNNNSTVKFLGDITCEQFAQNSLTFKNNIKLENISFSYAESVGDVLKELDIQINKNEIIGFVGTTGSGKTTLVDILLGLLTPQEGGIKVDEIPITEDNIRLWQQKIGYVPQEIYLSDDTIRKNIAYGTPEDKIDDHRIKIASKIAALDEFVESQLPQGYNTIIGERGVRLSGGQRQRIGLARALYRNPEVLVLDEATSSLDGSTEDAVLQAIRQASKARTVIMIAHRLNTLKDCDKIYILENGQITECGTYYDLLASSQKFREMAKESNNMQGLGGAK